MKIQEYWEILILDSIICLPLYMSNVEANGNSLVSCTACQAVEVQNFACDVNCKVIKGNKDDISEVIGLFNELMEKISRLNASLNEEKEKVTELIDENAALLQKVNQLNETQTGEKQRIDKWEDPRCAFAAQGSDLDVVIEINDSTIVFQNVSLNICNGYDVATGEFTATIAGAYTFNTHALSGGDFGYFRIKKNDDVICATWVADEPGDVTSCSTVTHLDIGDKVKVTGDNRESSRILDDRRGFSGIFIHKD